jgi:hypothetical protein
MLDRIGVVDWQAHKADPSAHHKADYRSGGGGGKTKPVQATIDQPDLLAVRFLRLLHVHADWAPNGIKLLTVKIDTGESSTYSVTFQIRTTTTDASPVTIATVATSASLEAETSVLTNAIVDAGSYVYAILPATDLNQLGLEFNFDII